MGLFLLFLKMKVILEFESPIELWVVGEVVVVELWVVAEPERLECCELKPN